MQGKLAEAGEAVRDGFFAAYYEALSAGRHTPEVRQYDSSGDAIAAYQQAIADGADLVIGPIDKEKVTEISLMPSLEVPVLSLNYPDTPPAEPLKGFYQFGLAVEDEARQVARQAFLEGHRQAMVIIPTQEWSERSARAFRVAMTDIGEIHFLPRLLQAVHVFADGHPQGDDITIVLLARRGETAGQE